MLYAPRLTRVGDIRCVVEFVDRPVNVLAWTGLPAVLELAAAGVSRISVGGWFAFSALAAPIEAAIELREHGTYGYIDAAQQARRSGHSVPRLKAVLLQRFARATSGMQEASLSPLLPAHIRLERTRRLVIWSGSTLGVPRRRQSSWDRNLCGLRAPSSGASPCPTASTMNSRSVSTGSLAGCMSAPPARTGRRTAPAPRRRGRLDG